jgi:predicted NAD/FAD-binding protein
MNKGPASIIPLPARGSGAQLDIAVVGSGIAGLGAAWLLAKRHRVTLYEREDRLGGHAHTMDVVVDGATLPVDTGFIVYNECNYPTLTRLFAHLGVETSASSMSFAVSVDGGRLEYSGGSWSGLFAQPLNLLRPSYLRMLRDTMRFFREAPLARVDGGDMALGEWLAARGYSEAFLYDHLLPMAAAIWSVPVRQMLRFPVASFVSFLHNHGLLRLSGRPQWRTVTGGSRRYVARIAADFAGRVLLGTPVVAVQPGPSGGGSGAVVVRDARGGAKRYDRVVIAAHADEALGLLPGADHETRTLLAAFRYQANTAVLHRDARLMPQRRRAWSSWNYLAERSGAEPDAGRAAGARVSVTYWMNRLQNLDPRHPVFVSLNPIVAPRPELTLAAIEYSHPAFDAAAIAAQRRLPAVQGRGGIFLCGSYCGYGFHEDALASGVRVAASLGASAPWAEQASMEAALPGAATAEAGD